MPTINHLSNGLTVIVEEMPHVRSAALDLVFQGGLIFDPPERVGAALILSELISRGAGPYSSRQLSDEFDKHGIRHGEAASHDRLSLSGAMVSDKLPKAIELFSVMLRNPHLPQDEIEPIRELLLQDIKSLPDNPSKRVMVELGERYYPAPFSRSSVGHESGLKNTDLQALKDLHLKYFSPQGAVISVAGNVTQAQVLDLVDQYFGDWRGPATDKISCAGVNGHFYQHLAFDSAQLQIAAALAHPQFGDRHYYAAKVAAGVLSGGMFGRLFVEVREKRGLCYSVFARHAVGAGYGTLALYAGTTPERAQETLDVMLLELGRIPGTVTAEELSRSKVTIRSALLIGEESSSGRAASNAGDYWLGGRVRGLNEIVENIEAVSASDIDELWQRFPVNSRSILTLGAKELSVN